MNYRFSVAILGLLLAATAAGDGAKATIEGRWLSADGDGWIDIRVDGGRLGGYIAGSPNDPENLEPRFDEFNPDPALRDRPLLGMQIIRDLEQQKNGKWKGRVYDPNSGKMYKCTLTLTDEDTLKLRGYVGVSLLGRTAVWTRAR